MPFLRFESMPAAPLRYLLLLPLLHTLVLLSACNALVCQISDPEDKQISGFYNCTDCPFCSLTSGSFHEVGIKDVEKKGEESDALNSIMQLATNADSDYSYNILGVCLLESYYMQRDGEKDYVIRCFCNTDNCNTGDSVYRFAKHLQVKDMLGVRHPQKSRSHYEYSSSSNGNRK